MQLDHRFAGRVNGRAQPTDQRHRDRLRGLRITYEAPTLRHFTSFSQAADENAVSRIYVGFHFRDAVRLGTRGRRFAIVIDEAHRLGGSTERIARYRLGKALAAGRRGDLHELMANVAAYSGLRWGELAALATSSPYSLEIRVSLDDPDRARNDANAASPSTRAVVWPRRSSPTRWAAISSSPTRRRRAIRPR